MPDYQVTFFNGQRGEVAVHRWAVAAPRLSVLLVHGYGEHLGRYHHVAAALNAIGAEVVGPDHQGHGQSAGERVLIEDFDSVVTDLYQVAGLARARHPALPTLVIGHSMGGMIATRFAQRYPQELRALALSGPLLGEETQITQLATLAEIPDTPLDVTTLSRDPAVGRAYQADERVWHGPFRRPTLNAMRTMLAAIHAGPGLGALPTLWQHGEDDRLVRVSETRTTLDRLRGSDFSARLYPGAQHEIFNETNQDEVLRDLRAFIARTLG